MGTISRTAKAGGGTNYNSGQIIDPTEVNTDENTLFSEINGNLDDANIETATIPGSKSLRFTEISAPSSPSSNDLLAYGFDVSGVSLIQTKDSAGTTINLGQQVLPGTSVTAHRAPAALAGTAGVATGANTTETDVLNVTLKGNSMSTNGDVVEMTIYAKTAANANNKRFRAYFGGTTVLDTTAVAWNNQAVEIRVRVQRSGATTQNAVAYYFRATNNTEGTASTFLNNTTPGETLSGDITFRSTITNGTANANDIIVFYAHCVYLPAS